MNRLMVKDKYRIGRRLGHVKVEETHDASFDDVEK